MLTPVRMTRRTVPSTMDPAVMDVDSSSERRAAAAARLVSLARADCLSDGSSACRRVARSCRFPSSPTRLLGGCLQKRQRQAERERERERGRRARTRERTPQQQKRHATQSARTLHTHARDGGLNGVFLVKAPSRSLFVELAKRRRHLLSSRSRLCFSSKKTLVKIGRAFGERFK